MGRHDSRYRHGFTLVELLVVIAIIAILIALLLPAVQAAREAARRTQCSNHLKQIGISLHNYHAAESKFPIGELYIHWLHNPLGLDEYYAKGWSVRILPYIEQLELSDQFTVENGIWGTFGPNQIHLGLNRVKIFQCPSDGQDELIHVGGAGNTYTNHPEGIMFYSSNVGGVADSVSRWKPRAADIYQCHVIEGDGMLMNIKPIRIRDVFDGTSNTLMVGEVTGGEPGSRRGHWWVNWNVFSTPNGINGPATIPGEGFYQRIEEICFSSYHPGGCHFLRADGSVHFESENIDQVILTALTTRAGGEVISASDL